MNKTCAVNKDNMNSIGDMPMLCAIRLRPPLAEKF